MGRAAPLQSSFTGGEFSPLMYGRVDTDRYRTGLATCLNYKPTIQGGLVRRSGSYYVAEVKTSAKATRLVPFEFSTTQAYIIEFGDQYCRFFRNHGAIRESAKTITDITQANPAVVTSTAHGYSNGEVVYISGVVGMTEVNGKNFTVANQTANTYELSGIDSTAYTAYTSGGTAEKIYEIATPYLEADLFDLRFAQSADILYITHPSYAPRKLSRTAHTTWTLTEIDFLDGPYLSTNTTATTLTPSAATGSGITITASATTGINGGDGFKSTDVGRLIRMKEGSTWGYVEIVGFTSTTVVTADVKSTLTNTNAKTDWRLGVWSDTTGHPACVTFYEDRLFFGGATDYPQRIDGSRSSDYEDFAPSDNDGTITDSHGISYTLNSNTVNAIRWLSPTEKGLLVGTTGAIWAVRASSQDEALTPTNVKAKPSPLYGSAHVQPVAIGKTTVYVQRAGRKLRELRHFFEEDGFEAPDLNLLADHVTLSGVKELTHANEPQSLVWAVRNDGVLACMTYERTTEVLRVGWHRHILGGVSDASGSATVTESAATIPSPTGDRDETWVLTQRYVDGAAVRYIEYLTQDFEVDMDLEDAFFVDCGLTYDGAATTTITGLDHLEGETISLLVDGAVHPDKTISSGSVTLDYAGAKVHAGYGYNSDGKTLRPEAGANDGTALGKTRRMEEMGLLLHRTSGLSIGMSFDELDEITFRTSADASDNPPALFSGVLIEPLEADYDYDNQFCWRQSQPLPGTILALMPKVVTQSG